MTILTYKTKDRDKGITRVTYNDIGLVDSILFDNGAKVLYTYGINGEKLRVRHFAATSNMVSPIIHFQFAPIRPGINTIGYDEEEYVGGDFVKKSSGIGTVYEACTYNYYFGDGYITENPMMLSTIANKVINYYYYSKDHLGNVRSVVTKSTFTNAVTEVQKTHYYPFGGIIADLSTGRSEQNRLYNGKELDTSNNLWWYDYGARQYDPTAPRFTTPDPLAHKYYGWNIYGYCLNNPVMFVDPDGKKIRFADGVSDAFKENFAKAVNYLKENKCDGLLAKLEKRNEIIYIAERNDGTSPGYNHNNHTIYWDPYGGVSTTNNKILSPTTVLNHEADHAYEHLTNKTTYTINSKATDELYRTKEEKRVITGSEQRTALALGEIQLNEKTRDDHIGFYYPTVSPISTELDMDRESPTLLKEIEVKPQ